MSVAVPVIDYIDGINRRVHLKTGVTSYHPIDDIYKEYRTLRRIDESLRKFYPLLKADGSVPKGGGKRTPRYMVLLHGTKIIPFNDGEEMSQTGEIITDNPDVDATIYDTSGITLPKIINIAPSEAEIIEVSTGATDLTDIELKITELYKIHGLSVGSPMTVTQTSRTVDDISQEISGDGETTTTITRV